MRRMSQWMFCARSEGTEMVVGRIIHRITRDTTSGLRVEEWVRKVCKKEEMGVCGVTERRWIVQRGIVVCGFRWWNNCESMVGLDKRRRDFEIMIVVLKMRYNS